MFTKHIHKNRLHHAYCIVGRGEELVPSLVEYCVGELEIPQEGNPDFSIETLDVFGVQEGKQLQSRQSRAALLGGRKVFIISFSTITSEAQNALLKVFEEPAPSTHFFLITPEPNLLLPTLRSRLVIVSFTEVDSLSKNEAKKFLSLTLGEKMNFVKDLAEEKDKSYIATFLDEVECVLREGDLYKNKGALEACLNARKYLFDRASSVKMLLEYIALSV